MPAAQHGKQGALEGAELVVKCEAQLVDALKLDAHGGQVVAGARDCDGVCAQCFDD